MQVKVEASKNRIKELVGDINFSKIENILDGLVNIGYRDGIVCKYEREDDTSFKTLYESGVPIMTIINRYEYSARFFNQLEDELVANGTTRRPRKSWSNIEPATRKQLLQEQTFDTLVEEYDVTITLYLQTCSYYKLTPKASCVRERKRKLR